MAKRLNISKEKKKYMANTAKQRRRATQHAAASDVTKTQAGAKHRGSKKGRGGPPDVGYKEVRAAQTRGVPQGQQYITPEEAEALRNEIRVDQRVQTANLRRARRLAAAQPPIERPPTDMSGFGVRSPGTELARRGDYIGPKPPEGYVPPGEQLYEPFEKTARPMEGGRGPRGYSEGPGPRSTALALRPPPGELAKHKPPKKPSVVTPAWIKSFTGTKFPASAERVKEFLGKIGVIGKKSEIPTHVAQRIANRMSDVAPDRAAETLSRAANGLRDMVAANKGRPPLQSIMEFFEVSDSRIAAMGSRVGHAGRAVGRTAMKAAGSPIGATGLFGLAAALSKYRESKAIGGEAEMGMAMLGQNPGEAMFERELLDDLRKKAMLRNLGSSGMSSGSMSAQEMEALLGGGEEEGPMRPISLPPSSGFPTPGATAG